MDVADPDRSKRLPGALLAYALALAVFLLIPPTLKPTVGPPVWFTLQEAADLFTPVVVIPLAWYVMACCGGVRSRVLIAFLVIAAVWVEGQGIHLAANSIGDAFARGVARDAFYATEAGDLHHWLGEGPHPLMVELPLAPPTLLMPRGATPPRAGPGDP